MEIFVEDGDCPKSRFLQLEFGYLQIMERNLGKIMVLNKNAKNALKIESLPLLMSSKLTNPLIGNEIEIAKFIADESLLKDLLFGKENKEKELIDKEINHIVNELKYDGKKLLPELNKNLEYCTFLNDSMTLKILDILSFAVVAPLLNNLSNEEKNLYCNVVRWANHIQNLKGISDTIRDLKLSFSIPYIPFIIGVPEESKKKEKKHKPQGNKEDEKKKDKKEEKKEVHLMSKVDIRVGKIVNIFPNEQGDKLYNEEIDIGNGEIRKIGSGLREFVKIEDLKDSLVVVICNLRPKNLKGWKSHGMILCAETKDQKHVEPLRPPQGSQPGDLVYIGDLPREPVSDKNCPWDKVCVDLMTNDKKVATYKGTLVWKTDKGEITATTISDGVIR